MAFNSIGQYTANHKTWDRVGNILPNVEHSEGERPHIEWKPAAWLPVQFYDKHFENWYVIMPGKVLACDPDGRLVPAGLRLATELVGSGDVVTYTQNDVDALVTNVTTGLPVTAAQLTDNGGTSIGYTITEINTAGFLGDTDRELTISNPVGVAPYAFHKWAGGDGSNPFELDHHNYQMQHQVAVLCDYVLTLPLVPGSSTEEALVFSTPTNNITAASGVDNLPIALNTVRTPITFAGGASATLFVNQVELLSEVTSAGDWHVDLDSGVVTTFSASAPTGVTMSYYHYAAAPTSATMSKFTSVVGDVKPGDLVTFDADSNLRIANATTLFLDASPTGAQVARSHALIVGQILDRDSGHPKDLLDRVKTSYSPALNTDSTGARPAYLGQLDQMPGSATGGMPAEIHYSGAADTMVRVNLTRF